MGIKQEELEAFMQQENDDIFAVMETWWNDLHKWVLQWIAINPSQRIVKEGKMLE